MVFVCCGPIFFLGGGGVTGEFGYILGDVFVSLLQGCWGQ